MAHFSPHCIPFLSPLLMFVHCSPNRPCTLRGDPWGTLHCWSGIHWHKLRRETVAMRAAATAAIASLTPTMLSWQWCVCFEAMGTRVVVRNTQLRVSAEWCTLLDSLSKEKKSIRASPFTMLLMFYHTYERRLEREGWCKSIHSNCLQLLHDWVVWASCNCVSWAADLDTHILNRYWANARWRH